MICPTKTSFFLLLLLIVHCGQPGKTALVDAFPLPLEQPPNKDTLVREQLKTNLLPHRPIFALVHAKVIDGSGNPPLENQTLLVQNGHFKYVGKDSSIALPKETEIIDASGKTIIPGLVGVHNHLHIPGSPFLGSIATRLYLASGVTTIQTCGAAAPYQEMELADSISMKLVAGPDIVNSAPYFTGTGGNENMIVPRNAAHIRDTMQYWMDKGIRWFKIYRNTSPSDLQTIIEEAHKRGAKVTGHLCSITFQEAVDMGIDGIEHGLNSASDFRTNKIFGKCGGERDYMDHLVISSKKVQDLHRSMIDHNVFLTSTLSIFETSIPSRAIADNRSLKLMSPSLLSQYGERRKQFNELLDEGEQRENRLKRIMAFELQFFRMGGTLTAGSDPGRHNLPGYGDQRNFELLIEAGFNLQEAVMIVTTNGAKVLERSDIGTIKNGKRADFVILNGDLGKDPRVIRQVEAVFKEGIGYDPNSLLKGMEGKVGQ